MERTQGGGDHQIGGDVGNGQQVQGGLQRFFDEDLGTSAEFGHTRDYILPANIFSEAISTHRRSGSFNGLDFQILQDISATGGQIQGSSTVFDTPQSLLSSPQQYPGNIFTNSPILTGLPQSPQHHKQAGHHQQSQRGHGRRYPTAGEQQHRPLGIQQQLGRIQCCFCQRDTVQGKSITIPVCNHRYCEACIPFTEGCRNCPICNPKGLRYEDSLEQQHGLLSGSSGDFGAGRPFQDPAPTFSIWDPKPITTTPYEGSQFQNSFDPSGLLTGVLAGSGGQTRELTPRSAGGAPSTPPVFSPSPLDQPPPPPQPLIQPQKAQSQLQTGLQQVQTPRFPPPVHRGRSKSEWSRGGPSGSITPRDMRDFAAISALSSHQGITVQQHQNKPLCGSCVDQYSTSTVAVAFCTQCRDLLCRDCLTAHGRVRFTRDHMIVPVDQLHRANQAAQAVAAETTAVGTVAQQHQKNEQQQQVQALQAQRTESCIRHGNRRICVCETCQGTALCSQCVAEDHPKEHRIGTAGCDTRHAAVALLSEARAKEKNVEEALESATRMAERVDASIQAVGSELRSVIHLYISALEERKRDLLQRLDTSRTLKVTALKQQSEKLTARKAAIVEAVQRAHELLTSEAEGGSEQQAEAALKILLELFSQPRLDLQPAETDHVKFVAPESALMNKMRSLGTLETGPCARESTLVGEAYRRAIRDRPCSILIQLRDACGDSCVDTPRNHCVQATVTGPDGLPLETHIVERELGNCAVTYQPVQDGQHVLDVTVRGVSIQGCPAVVEVRRGRNYSEIQHNGELFSFGGEGTGDGQLCRPWGICCDLKSRILVADRSNNRIQVFDKDGHFLMKFGTSGVRPGQFDRPAGITNNTLNHIVVADKDNHRIQVFDENGQFVLKFGERGRQVGMFNYPWGVATNSQNQIAVSDTRNHRVQVFSAQGQFIRKCGFDSSYFFKHLDSPRGVCYLPDGQLIITDFNNHRLAVTSPRNTDMKCYGCEGEAEGQFCRPQGVKTDNEGHILVCDSRNNRIQVFSLDDMRCVASWGSGPTAASSSAEGGASSGASSAQVKSPSFKPNFELSNEMNIYMQSAHAAFASPQGLGLGQLNPALQGLSLSSSSSGGSLLSQKQNQGQSSAQNLESGSRPFLDRPTDLCVSPDGRVYVVDFGNNCVRVF